MSTNGSPRISPLPHEQWDERIQGYDIADEDGEFLNAYRTVANHPRLFKYWLPFAGQILNNNTLPPREREMVILRTGWVCGSGYEWGQHVKLGRGAGLTDEEIARVAEGPDSPGWSPLQALLLRATDEMHADDAVADATYEALAEHLDTNQLLDLVFTVGHYQLVSVMFNTFRVQRDDGVTGVPFPKR
jgi:4-carboxymuconolactone decarboxylase